MLIYWYMASNAVTKTQLFWLAKTVLSAFKILYLPVKMIRQPKFLNKLSKLFISSFVLHAFLSRSFKSSLQFIYFAYMEVLKRLFIVSAFTC